jgi:hypothetical protein
VRSQRLQLSVYGERMVVNRGPKGTNKHCNRPKPRGPLWGFLLPYSSDLFSFIENVTISLQEKNK